MSRVPAGAQILHHAITGLRQQTSQSHLSGLNHSRSKPLAALGVLTRLDGHAHPGAPTGLRALGHETKETIRP